MSNTETPTFATLADYTTLRVGGPARRFVAARTADELVAVTRDADERGEPLLVLGGGSNMVVADDGFVGTVLRIASSGWTVSQGPAGADELRFVDVEAGQDWDEFVAAMVESKLAGIESLSGIPGLVGAAPIQNIGAYGWEISEFLDSVRFYDRATGVVKTIPASELGLSYRTSVLKGTDTGVVLSVRLVLNTSGLSQPIRYPELARELGVDLGVSVPADQVRTAVLALRRKKGMVLDATDHDTWSAGSFFTNPILPADELDAVLTQIRARVGESLTIPQYPAEGGVKLSAAWLIEQAGFSKGYFGSSDRAALSTKHTLAITNRGSATTKDVLTLAREVRDGVYAAFGVELYPEPLLINCSL